MPQAMLRTIPPTTTVPLGDHGDIDIKRSRETLEALKAADSAVSRRPIELPTESAYRPGRNERPAIAVYCRAISPDTRSSNEP